MSLSDKKLEKFEASVFKEADAEIEKLLAGIAEQKERTLSETRDAELARHFEQMQAEIGRIKSACIRRASLEELAAKKQLLLKREALSEQVFAEVAARLTAFTETDAYATFLQDALRKAIDACGAEGSCVYARAADAETMRALCGEIPVQIDRGITLGGFLFKNERQGVAVDNTFDSRLQAQRAYFNTISNLTLEE